MPLDKEDWESIYEAIRSFERPNEIMFAYVVKRDEKHRLIWVEEFGDTPIPLIGFIGTVTTFDVQPVNNIVDPDLDVEKEFRQNFARAEPVVPAVGETAAILRPFGSRRLPKCIGIFLSIGNYNPEDL